jgi:arginase
MSNLTSQNTIDIISVPFDLGASCRGTSFAPSVITPILLRKFENNGLVFNLFKTPQGTTNAASDINNENLKYLDEVVEINENLAVLTANSMINGHCPLILGGDHSIAIGSIAGIAANCNNLGVIWFDAHADLNTADTSPSGNIHGMSLAVSLGYGNRRLTEITSSSPKIKPQNVVIIGARDLDSAEKVFIRDNGITCFTMHEIDRMGMAAVIKEAIKIVSKDTDRVHLSFDLDSLDPLEAPGTGTPVRGGVTYREAHLAMELLYESGIITSAEFVELNPDLDIYNKTAILTVELICSLFGSRIL